MSERYSVTRCDEFDDLAIFDAKDAIHLATFQVRDRLNHQQREVDSLTAENQKLKAERDEAQAKVDEFVASIDGWKRDLGAQPGQTLTQALQAWMKRLAEAEGERDAAINHERDHLQQIAQFTLNLSAAKTERDALKREVDVEKSIRELVAKQCQDQYEVSKEAVARVKKLEDGIRVHRKDFGCWEDKFSFGCNKKLWSLLPPEESISEHSECRSEHSCEKCGGSRGGVPGNDQIVDGKVLCDYCHAEQIKSEKPASDVVDYARWLYRPTPQPQPQPQPEPEPEQAIVMDPYNFAIQIENAKSLEVAEELIQYRDAQLKREARMAALDEVESAIKASGGCWGECLIVINNLKAKEG